MNNADVNLLTICHMIRLVHSSDSEAVKSYARQQGRNALITWATMNDYPKAAYAHYFASKGKKVVIISEGFSPVGKEIPVTGKVDAKKVAKRYNATPWNF